MTRDTQLLEYVLRLADSDLILAQHLGEWVGHGPVLEEDIALTNVGLDLLGQARLWFTYAGEIEARIAGRGRSEDEFAFLRDASGFRNVLLVEQPNGNYAQTMARQFYFDAWHELLLAELSRSADARIAGIAAKGVKEARYHIERSAEWVIRLGDGTGESHNRMQAAIDDLWTYTGELFEMDATDAALVGAGIGCDLTALAPVWRERIGRGPGRGDAGGAGRHLDAERGQTRRAHRALRPPAGGNAVAAARASWSAMVSEVVLPPRDTTLDAAWQVLAAIPDPEIPVISIVELGIVRNVRREGDSLVVTVTPTYSGCPATAMIEADIVKALTQSESAACRVETQIAPAWTTDWIAPAARERLRAYGIVPPGERAAVQSVDISGLRRKSTATVACPRCGSARTTELSRFGSTPCKAQYRCEDCREPFDYFKPH